jgi:porin
MEKLIGWKGGSFNASAFLAYGENASAEFIGDFNGASNIFTDTDFNAFHLFVSQRLAEDMFFIKAGQIAVDDDFMSSETAGHFLNSAFGPLPTESGNTGTPIFPLAAPGALIRFTPNETVSFQAGLYAGDAGPVQSSNHGFEWRTGGSGGWATFAEGSFSYARGTAKIGGFYHGSAFEDFRDGSTREGLSAFYGIVDHHFSEPSTSATGLSVFARASLTPQEEIATVHQYYDAGITFKNLFRPYDTLGFAASHTVFGDAFGIANPELSSSETVLELTYQLPLTTSWSIQPDIQYILDPLESRDNALVIGLRTELLF